MEIVMSYHKIILSEKDSDKTAFRTTLSLGIQETSLWVKDGPSYVSENNKHCTQWVKSILMFYFRRQLNSLCQIIGKLRC
jgi:hypothetical protein